MFLICIIYIFKHASIGITICIKVRLVLRENFISAWEFTDTCLLDTLLIGQALFIYQREIEVVASTELKQITQKCNPFFLRDRS